MAAVVHEPSLISLLSSMHEVQPRLGLRAIALARTSIIAIRQVDDVGFAFRQT